MLLTQITAPLCHTHCTTPSIFRDHGLCIVHYVYYNKMYLYNSGITVVCVIICPAAPCLLSALTAPFCHQASRHPVMEQKASYEGQLRSVVDQLKEMEEEKRTFEEDKRAKERVHVEKLVREMSLHTLYI